MNDTSSARELLYLDGAVLPLADGRVSVEDRGLQFGDGVYEVVKVVNGRALWLEEHLSRLRVSLEQVRMDGALRGHDLGRAIPSLISESGLGAGTVYLQVTRGPGPREFAFPADPRPTVLAYTRARGLPDEEAIRRGVRLWPVEDIRWARCDIKATILLPAVLAKQKAVDAGAQEALWVDSEGVAREGASSNIFAVRGDELWTHPADGRILNGITRQKVLALAARLGLGTQEVRWRLDQLSEVTEVFLASTTNDVMPVMVIGGTAVGDGAAGPVTLRLADAFRQWIAELSGLPVPPPLSA